MQEDFQERICKAVGILKKARYLIIGGGAGLSAAAGITYSGDRFYDNFSDFADRYGLTDMYSAGFYPFLSEEEKWAYWSRHIKLNRYDPSALPLYKNIYSISCGKEYFVLTTNVDGQFEKAGFDPARIFAVQGDYGKFQCAHACSHQLYDNREAVEKMVKEQHDCRIPTELIPKCPVCGKKAEVNIRKDCYFVEDEAWHRSENAYRKFLDKAVRNDTALLEIGVGYNTPSLIRFPFDSMTYNGAALIRINIDYPEVPTQKSVSFSESAESTIKEIALKLQL